MLGIANALARQPGMHLTLICPKPVQGPDEMRAPNVSVRYLPEKKSGSVRWSLGVQTAILRALEEAQRSSGGLDGIVVGLRAGAISPALYCLTNRVPEVLVVESLEARNVANVYGRIPASRLMMNLVTWMNGLQSRRVFAAFEAVKSWIEAMPLVDPAKVERFHHGVDASHFKALEAQEARWPEGIPLARSDYVIGFAGSFKWYHRVDLLLRAAAEPNLQHAKLLLIGQGPTEGACREMARELGISGRVHFTGHVSHDRVGRLLSSCDALYGVIDPTHWGHAMKLYEYMASGVPFIYVMNDETEFLREMDVGRGISEAAVADVARALAARASLPVEERATAAARGRDFVLSECTWDQLASRIVSAMNGPRDLGHGAA